MGSLVLWDADSILRRHKIDSMRSLLTVSVDMHKPFIVLVKLVFTKHLGCEER